MRVGPVGWCFSTQSQTFEMARRSAVCTHNHPEGIKGAQAVALCIYWANHGADPAEIGRAVQKTFGYDLRMTVEELQQHYSWAGMRGKGNGATCQDSVPQAIVCALTANDFEDAVRNAVSIGGDSDTLACMAGSIAEALYGIPQTIYERGISYLPEHFKRLVLDFEDRFGRGVVPDVS